VTVDNVFFLFCRGVGVGGWGWVKGAAWMIFNQELLLINRGYFKENKIMWDNIFLLNFQGCLQKHQ